MKKKKILLFALSSVFLVGCAGFLVSCGEEHTHTYEQTGGTATCTEAGTITKTCSVCGDVVTENVDALGHDYAWKTSDDGTGRVYACSRCGLAEDSITVTVNNATLSYGKMSGTVKTTVSGSAVSLSDAVSVQNNDIDGSWWNGGTEMLAVSGDFVVQYAWSNTRDTSYTDAVVELTDGTKYWDNTAFADLWGDLYTEATTTSAKFYLNGEETTQVAMGTSDYFGGDYVVTIVRDGDGLIVCESLTKTDGSVFTYIITQSGFTTDTVSVGINGNPYWIDNITVASSQGTPAPTPDPTPDPDPDPTPAPTPVGDYISFEMNTATVKYNVKTGEVVTESSGAAVELGSETALTNYDTDGGTWWSGGTDTITATGDFMVRLTWSNTRDTSYTDAVIEINNGSKWWDANSFEGGGWGDLYTAASSTTEKFYLNGAETTKVALGTAEYFGGDYTATVVRSGTQLIVVINLVKTNGDVYTQIITQSGFTTDTVYVGINGNPYWIDNIKGAGAILGADLVNYTVNFLYEDGTTAAESVTYSVSEGASLTFNTPYVAYYMPEKEYYKVDSVTGDTSFDVVYSYCWDNSADYIDYGYISGENELTLPDNITLDTGVSISFLLSNSAAGSDWDWLISTQGYNITYGNLSSADRNDHTLYPSATAFGGENWNALLTTEEIFVTLNIYQDRIVFYKNGEKVIEYAPDDILIGDSYVYGVNTWARNILSTMIDVGFTFNAQTFTVHRLSISGAKSANSIKRMYEAIEEAYSSELVVKYICSQDDNHLLGEYRWRGLATDYSITPPDILGYEAWDSSARTGRAEYGRTTIYIDYEQTGIATLTLKYEDTEGNELKESETKQVTTPHVEAYAPEIEDYVAINDYEVLWTMKHGGSYTFVFRYKEDTTSHNYIDFTVNDATVSYCKDCGKVRTKFGGTKVSLSSAASLKNYDTDGAWWTGGTDTITVTDDFVVALTWKNTRDTSYTDAVIEMNDGTKYWDATTFEGGGWGDLYSAGTAKFYLNGEETTATALGTEGFFKGDYTATIVRNGDQLMVVVNLVKESGDVYAQVFTQTITTDTLYIGINGNPYWVDDVTGAYYIDKGNTCETHTWVDGVCSVCGTACTHTWESGTCSTCGLVCTHTWENGTCSTCGTVCTHNYENGTCTICGSVKSTSVVVTENSATLTYTLATGVADVTVDGKTISYNAAAAVTNNDTDGAWWNGATASTALTGDFVAQYTWKNTRDTSYTDVVLELTDGTKYWDNTIFDDNGWGDLYTGATVVSDKFYLNGVETSEVALGTASYFEGTYTATIVRNGSGLIVCVNLAKTNGDQYAWIIEQSDFSTADLTVCLTGNPYWVDDITIATGYASVVVTESNATLAYNVATGAVDVKVSGSSVTLGAAAAVTNNDTDGAWWNGATASTALTGDFVAQYTWKNTRDTSYTDVVLELTDGTKYWDNTIFDDNGWGDLYTGATVVSDKFYLNGVETSEVALGTASYFEGTYTATIVRNGSGLIVCVNLAKTNGDQYAWIIEQSDFSTADLTVCLTGNPYWVDDITIAS